MTKLRKTIPIPSESAAQWTALSAKSKRPGGRTFSFVPVGLKASENVKTSPRGPLAQIRLRQPNAQRSGWPLAGQRDKHSQVGQLFQGQRVVCSSLCLNYIGFLTCFAVGASGDASPAGVLTSEDSRSPERGQGNSQQKHAHRRRFRHYRDNPIRRIGCDQRSTRRVIESCYDLNIGCVFRPG